jgi:calcineurin-like phosphoesterase family protein
MNLPYTFIDKKTSIINILNTEKKTKQKKRVHFQMNPCIHLIPTRKELSEEIPFHYLWWSKNEYQRFQMEANNDLRFVFMHYPFITPKEAFQLLYQTDMKQSISLRQSNNMIRIIPLLDINKNSDFRSGFF